MLGLGTITDYDTTLLPHINMVMLDLNQLGIGPEAGLVVINTTEWSAVTLSNIKLEGIKTYMFLKIKLLFDPPSSAYVVEAINRQLANMEWRLNLAAEET